MIVLDLNIVNILIEREAFKNIVIHTAEYAHFDMKVRNWKEVYGFLVGDIDDEYGWVHVTAAYPITHGTHYGVEFKKKHYVLSSYLNLMIAEQDLWIVGWYHSHPGLDLFLSEVDVINHLAYQIANPKAIALVFDHTKIISDESPLRIFQLDNPAYGISSNYHEVEYFIGGFNKKEQTVLIKNFYYEIEPDVISKKIPPIEKEMEDKVKQWYKKDKNNISHKIKEQEKEKQEKRNPRPFLNDGI